jgi:diguanylate cyclase (GGDEF)-like protein
VLRSVAGRLSASVRAGDVVARLGGDEFVLLLPEAGEGRVLQRLLKRILVTLKRPMLIGTSRMTVTCSSGVACFPRDGSTLQSLLEVADRDLYRVKATRHPPTVPS